MPVYVIDTLKPKNGLDFPVVEAVDVAVEGYASLADAVTHFATDTAITAINAALDLKADKTTTASLQAQIDQIVISASAEAVVAPEVAAARVGADGTSYQTLKARLDTENSIITNDIKTFKSDVLNTDNLLLLAKIIPNKYYSNGTESASEDYTYAIVPMEAGKTYVISTARIIAYETGDPIATYTSSGYELTPSESQNVYITFNNDIHSYLDWKVYEKGKDGTQIGTYHSPTLSSAILAKSTGTNDNIAISQKAVSDVFANHEGRLEKLTEVSNESEILLPTFDIYKKGNLYELGTNKFTGKYYVAGQDDKIHAYSNESYSCFILRVIPYTNYSCLTARFICLMPNKEDVSETLENKTSFNTGNNEYIAVSYKHDDYPDYAISIGDTVDTDQISYQIPDINAIVDGTIYGGKVFGNLYGQATDIIVGRYYTENSQHKLSSLANDAYTGFVLKVKKNTIYSCLPARFVCLMPNSEDVSEVISNVETFNTANSEYIAVSYRHGDYPNYAISEGTPVDTGDLKYEIPWLHIPSTERNYKGIIQAEFATLAANTSTGITNAPNARKNSLVQFGASFETFSGIAYTKGLISSVYYGKIEITDTELIIQNGSTETSRLEHGLTIDDYIYVNVKKGDDDTATITISTASGTAKYENLTWYGFAPGDASIKSTAAATNGYIKIRLLDYNKPVAIFGDSYLNVNNSTRWPYHVKQLGYDAWYIDGYPGGGSTPELASFNNVIKVLNAKTVIWAIGMNNGDDSEINPYWKAAIDSVIAYCAATGVELILATIPNVPTVDNTYKNAYIKSLGLRYIDFAKAVGAEIAGSTWYTGMLSSDGVHPSEAGAKALAMQAMADAPEICDN